MDHSPSLKQYETQVLNMRVNGSELDIDDSDLQIDLNLNRNHVYHVDTSSILGRSNSPCSNGGGGMLGRQFAEIPSASSSKTPILKTFQQHLASVEKADSVTNPIYERSDDDDSINSRVNDNVHFRKERYRHGKPTTEL